MLPVVLEKNRLAASMSRRLFTMLPPALSRGAEPEAGEMAETRENRFVGTIGNYPADVASVRAGNRIYEAFLSVLPVSGAGTARIKQTRNQRLQVLTYFRQFRRSSFMTRMGYWKSRWFQVDDSGSMAMSEGE